MSTVEVCTQIESHSCCILGETYRFKVQPAAGMADTRPVATNHTVLHIEAFQPNRGGRAVARMRITAPTSELERIPTLLTKALEGWLLANAVPAGGVH